ncbi:MAG: serine--tRNA ligase [Candidatus Melainabacteria bacterium]|nr:serine--tRNA ligase [Candidatus Melainabacteria bacterium]
MLDIKFIKAHREQVERAALDKGIAVDIGRLLELAESRRGLSERIETLQALKNQLTRQLKNAGKQAATVTPAEALMERSKEAGVELARLKQELKEIESELERLMLLVPGVPAGDVPRGAGDADNVEIRRRGEVRQFDFVPRDHMEILARHGLVDCEGPRKFAGSRAYALLGDAALLELAVTRFALDTVVARGFTAVVVPHMVRPAAMVGTGYFPLGEENAYRLERDELVLAGTSEVALVALQADRIFEENELPLRLAGISTCYRREAGAAGRDTRGLYRVHQFQKVEQVVFCRPDEAEAERLHYELLGNAEAIMQELGLAYRVVAVATGDMGQGQVRKHDIEAWMPSRGAYGETHSCSTLNDFQARRLKIRVRESAGRRFVYTLNNTAIASPRILIAIIENYQNRDGTVTVPEALRPYMPGPILKGL